MVVPTGRFCERTRLAMPIAPPVRAIVAGQPQPAALACVKLASEAVRLAPRQADRSAHQVRREMKRLRAIVRLVPQPRPGWLESVRLESVAIHRELAAVCARCAVEETLDRLRAKHPARWPGALPVRAARKAAAGQAKIAWADIGRRLGCMGTLLTTRTQGFGPDIDPGKLLRRAYRKARRAREAAGESLDQQDVHTWRKAMRQLCIQLQFTTPLLSRPARKLEPQLGPLTRKLGHCGDLAMAGKHLASRRLSGAAARARDDLVVWLERRRRKLAREILSATAESFGRRPRDFAKWCGR